MAELTTVRWQWSETEDRWWRIENNGLLYTVRPQGRCKRKEIQHVTTWQAALDWINKREKKT